MTTKEININDTFEVLGHRFAGLQDVRKAVEISSNIPYCEDKPYITTDAPKTRIPGVYVLEVYEGYPCFDSSDYAFENRFFRNFFFSPVPFTRQQVANIAKLHTHNNGTIKPENIAAIGLPHLYYLGDYDKMELTQ